MTEALPIQMWLWVFLLPWGCMFLKCENQMRMIARVCFDACPKDRARRETKKLIGFAVTTKIFETASSEVLRIERKRKTIYRVIDKEDGRTIFDYANEQDARQFAAQRELYMPLWVDEIAIED